MQYTTEEESDAELLMGAPLNLHRQGSYVDIKLLREQQMKRLGEETWIAEPLTVWVFGASGDLAKKKTYPSLFALYEGGMLPPSNLVQIVGYARSDIPIKDFRTKLEPYLLGSKPTDQRKNNVKQFLKRCSYFSGQYDSSADAARLHNSPSKENRLFYLALPPGQFVSAAQMIKDGAMSPSGFNRLVVEKPFGRDTETAKQLGKDMALIFSEDFLYRIDHYLGKEMVQNIIVLRFANAWLEPTWNRHHISAVQISFKEDIGTKGRGGYFDSFGIIRDVIQNHLMQVFSITAMEPPVRVTGQDYANFVRDEKVKVLKAVRKLRLEDVVIGQYVGNSTLNEPGYLEDETVPPGSNCPTFATCILYVDNARWQGVPFIIKAGKALDDRRAEIRVQFRPPAAAAMMFGNDNLPQNELVLRLQPNEAIYMKTNVKQPGLGTDPIQTELDLNYDRRYPMQELQDAYTRLLLDVLRGKQATFVRDDELMAAWEIFTPVLHDIERGAIKPIPYVFGTRGPKESDDLIQKVGFTYNKDYAQGWAESQKHHKM
ncbi:glucose-6-phosphate dehydrogenase [Batrachochytrium salamandrivorans]|nr:glucose-6-phosphate dehydrogenase [Batrachochytrium salamandrivorans]